LHTKIVLRVSLLLIGFGALLFFLLAIRNTLQGRPWSSSLLASLFQSVTARTCGFNTVDIGQLANPTLLVLMVLMFIGASPGSTGGGIKTTSFSLMMLMIWNKIKGQDEVNVFNRTIPREILNRTVAVIIASMLIVFIVVSFLLFANQDTGVAAKNSRHNFVLYLFEAISAFGTVGLSLGITAELSAMQKSAVIILMFVGRIGPITLAYAWYSRKSGLVYAEESVMVG
jgi:trk system potassium uptake protein TrkH